MWLIKLNLSSIIYPDKHRYEWKTHLPAAFFYCSVEIPGRKNKAPRNCGFIMSDGFQREIKWGRGGGVQAWGLRVKGVSDSGSVTPLISQTTHPGSKQMKLKTGENNNNKDYLTIQTSRDLWPVLWSSELWHWLWIFMFLKPGWIGIWEL